MDYFDFYLLHNVCEIAWDFYTNKEIGLVDYLLEQKKAGRIKHLGFSAHCRPETLETFLRLYPCFEFVQIQLNYLDWTLQAAKQKYDIITSHGIPVWVMEPCRGGRLANFNDKTNALLKKIRPHDSIASWAFRWVKSLPNVQMVLSGMNTLEQLRDNVKTFSDDTPLTVEDQKALDEVVKTLVNLIPCTACRYCCEGCPQNLDIPKLIAMYNEANHADAFSWMQIGFTLDAMKETELPVSCIACGSCAQVCPQNIDIPAVMKKLNEAITAKKNKELKK